MGVTVLSHNDKIMINTTQRLCYLLDSLDVNFKTRTLKLELLNL